MAKSQEIAFSREQMMAVKSGLERALEHASSRQALGIDIKCIACEGGLNIVAGAAIGAAIAAGVAIAPEAAFVVAIAAFLDDAISAAVIAGIINGAIGSGTGVAVETVIYEICKAAKACG